MPAAATSSWEAKEVTAGIIRYWQPWRAAGAAGERTPAWRSQSLESTQQKKQQKK
jgi:hypothetical protein